MSLNNQLLDPWAIYEYDLGDGPLWVPNPVQRPVVESNARHRLLAAGRRTGKSDFGGRVLIPEALATYAMQDDLRKRGKRREFWIVGPEYSDPEKEFRVLWNLCERLQLPIEKPGSYYDPIGGSFHLKLWKGTFQVHGHSAKYPQHLVGEQLCGVIMAEAAKMKPSIWVKYIRPMLSDNNGWSLHTSTPEGKNHFYEHFELGQNPAYPEWESWQAPSWRNPHVFKTPTNDYHVKLMLEALRRERGSTPRELVEKYNWTVDTEVLELAADLSVEMFKQEIMADFTEFVGQVFSDYDEEYHVGNLHYNPDWKTYAAVDWGYSNPSVWLLIQEGPWGEINVLDEVYEKGLTANDFAAEIKRRGLNPPTLGMFYPDPASPGDSRILSDALRVGIGPNTGGELAHRINLIRKALRTPRMEYSGLILGEHDKFRPQLMFDRKCVRTRADMLAYRYPDQTDVDEPSKIRFEQPMKVDDHGPEALGRFFAGRYGAQSLWGQAGTRVTRARISRGRARPQGQGLTAESVGMKPLKAMRPTLDEEMSPTFRKD